MKSVRTQSKALIKDKRAVFGLTSVQQFFAIILGVAMLAYVIVVIMGTLNGSTVLPTSSLSTTVTNESGFLNNTGYTFLTVNVPGFASPTIVSIKNATSGLTILAANYTLSGNVLKNATTIVWNPVNITYSYSYNAQTVNDANSILSNTSAGVTSFFSSINPVYAILAILVIILILVVLVRVVSGGQTSGSSAGPTL